MNQTYELQCARAERKRWKDTACQMYELIKQGDLLDAQEVFIEQAYKFTEEHR